MTRLCAAASGVAQIEFIQNFGNYPPLSALLDPTMLSLGGRVFVSADGSTTLSDASFVSYVSVLGTKVGRLGSGGLVFWGLVLFIDIFSPCLLFNSIIIRLLTSTTPAYTHLRTLLHTHFLPRYP